MSKVLVVGSSVVDLTFYSARIPAVGETVLGRFQQGLGGKGFNQAVGAKLAGAEVTFVSAVGADAFGPQFQKKMMELGVTQAFETVPGQATGAAAIAVDGSGRNSIIVALGANDRLSPSFLKANEGAFSGVGVLLLQLETNLEVIESAIRLAREKNPRCLVILNPAPALPRLPEAILSQVDFLTPNETELATLTGRATGTEAELASACAALAGPAALLVTLGDRGAYFWRKRDGRVESASLPAFRVDAVDTSGAGDAFNGAFAAAMVEFGGDWARAARFASAAAAISVTRPGTSASVASRPEIDAFLKERNAF